MDAAVSSLVYEQGVGGSECDWRRVLAWEPPYRLVVTWQINGQWQYDPDPEGGDNFTVLAQGTNRLGGAVDLDALVEYFAANSPVPPGPRIASPWRPSSISWIRPANRRNTPSTNR